MSDVLNRWKEIISAEMSGLEMTTETYVAIAEDTVVYIADLEAERDALKDKISEFIHKENTGG